MYSVRCRFKNPHKPKVFWKVGWYKEIIERKLRYMDSNLKSSVTSYVTFETHVALLKNKVFILDNI